jgi:hypothetical protein
MMMGFVEDEITFKTTWLIYGPMVISNTLVSCVNITKNKIDHQ